MPAQSPNRNSGKQRSNWVRRMLKAGRISLRFRAAKVRWEGSKLTVGSAELDLGLVVTLALALALLAFAWKLAALG